MKNKKRKSVKKQAESSAKPEKDIELDWNNPVVK